MITTPNDHPVTCEACGEPASRRNITVKTSRGVVHTHYYDSHDPCMKKNEHALKLSRLDDFFEACEAIEEEIRALPAADLDLSYGKILTVDIKPTPTAACHESTEARIFFTCGAFMQTRELSLPDPVKIQGLNARKVVQLIRPLAEPVALEFKDNFDRGKVFSQT